uniref:Uncharacterized protein n=1 Tax=Onchocerca volvulus TaxID=6282 RepID=A0A8R1XNV3_ONCVO
MESAFGTARLQGTSNKDSPVSSTSFNATFPNTSRTNRSNLEIINFMCPINSKASYDQEMREKLDQFKSEILDDIIQRDVYTDRTVFQGVWQKTQLSQ